MKKKILLLALCVAAVGGLAAQTRGSTEEIQRELRFLEDRYFRYLSYEERREAVRAMDRIMEMVRLQNQPAYGEREIRPEQFRLLRDQIRTMRSDGEKFRQILKIGEKWDFRCEQLAELVATFGDDQTKVNCILELREKIIDPRHSDHLLRVIYSVEMRRKVQKYL